MFNDYEWCDHHPHEAQSAELNDDLLAQLENNAPAHLQTQINEVVNAFDEFDFDQAQHVLDGLIKEFTQE